MNAAGAVERSPDEVEGVERQGARVLVAEDDPTLGALVLRILEEAGYRVDHVDDGQDALRALDRELYDLVLLDLHLPRVSGLNVLSAGPSLQTDAQFVVMTAFGSVDSAVEAMKLGAYDYLRKPFRADELLLVLGRALEELRLRREVAQLRRTANRHGPAGMVGRSAGMRRLHDLVERFAPTRATVLVTGETGTGKELVARAVHELSPRSGRSFVAVNCSALPEGLLEAELFGHLKGSFTGALQTRRGLFEEASGETLFLDEVSAVSPAIQVKLLRVLQDRVIHRVGSNEPVKVDFRLVAATNQDLSELVEEGTFREDLFYRLQVFPVWVPPLRERKDDIPLLAHHFRDRFVEENEVLDPPDLEPETLARMVEYDWPGNVRELENFMERAVILHAGRRSIPFDLPVTRARDGGGRVLGKGLEEEWDLDRLEREYILTVLDRNRWHQGQAADRLGINRRTLYRKLKRYREEGVLGEILEN